MKTDRAISLGYLAILRRVKQQLGFVPPAATETAAVFVRVPVAEARKLDRASYESGRPKREIVAELLSSLQTSPLEVGRAEIATGGDVLTLEEAAALLRVDEGALQRLATRRGVPGRRIGDEWRFSRAALLEWLASPEAATREPTAPRGATRARTPASRR
jgi:excisionase family DNA binding protein